MTNGRFILIMSMIVFGFYAHFTGDTKAGIVCLALVLGLLLVFDVRRRI